MSNRINTPYRETVLKGETNFVKRNEGWLASASLSGAPAQKVTTHKVPVKFGNLTTYFDEECEPYFKPEKIVARYNRLNTPKDTYKEIKYPNRNNNYNIIVDHIGALNFNGLTKHNEVIEATPEEYSSLITTLYKWIGAKFGSYTTVKSLAKEEYEFFNKTRHEEDENWLILPWEKAKPKVQNNAKASIRWNYKANLVLIIVPLHEETEKAQWWAEIWSQHSKDVYFLGIKKCRTGKRKLDYELYLPDCAEEQRLDNINKTSKIKDFVNEYSGAFDINLDAPVYRADYTASTGVNDNYFNRHERWRVKGTFHEDEIAKAITSPEKFRKSRNTAKDTDIQTAYEQITFYNSVDRSMFLAEGYQLCPCCKRPMKMEKMVFNFEYEAENYNFHSDIFQDIEGFEDGSHCKCGFFVPAYLAQEDIDTVYDDTTGTYDDEFDFFEENLNSIEDLFDNPECIEVEEDESEFDTIAF